MNAAHLHISLVHIPVVLIPMGFILLLIGRKTHSLSITRTALATLITATLVLIPAFLLGEGAEEIIEHLPGVSEDLIENHEEVADISLWLTVGTGILSIVSWFMITVGARLERSALTLTAIISFAASSSLIYTAQQGGKIRHPEISTPSSEPSSQPDDPE